jgi:hypothetical protein
MLLKYSKKVFEISLENKFKKGGKEGCLDGPRTSLSAQRPKPVKPVTASPPSSRARVDRCSPPWPTAVDRVRRVARKGTTASASFSSAIRTSSTSSLALSLPREACQLCCHHCRHRAPPLVFNPACCSLSRFLLAAAMPCHPCLRTSHRGLVGAWWGSLNRLLLLRCEHHRGSRGRQAAILLLPSFHAHRTRLVFAKLVLTSVGALPPECTGSPPSRATVLP